MLGSRDMCINLLCQVPAPVELKTPEEGNSLKRLEPFQGALSMTAFAEQSLCHRMPLPFSPGMQGC